MTLAAANAVLATFEPGWSFAWGKGLRRVLYLQRENSTDSIAVLLRSDRLWLRHRTLLLPGTVEQAVVQLALWIRKLPRRPLAWWRYLVSESVGLGSEETINRLTVGGYNDPHFTRCVHCGAFDPRDWWALGKLVGPCCMRGPCVERRKGT